MGVQTPVTKMVMLVCIVKIQAAKTSLERFNTLAKDLLPLMTISRRHSNLMKTTKRLFGMAAMLHIGR